MGFFDRVKKAFGVKPKTPEEQEAEEAANQTKKDQDEVAESSAVTAPSENDSRNTSETPDIEPQSQSVQTDESEHAAVVSEEVVKKQATPIQESENHANDDTNSVAETDQTDTLESTSVADQASRSTLSAKTKTDIESEVTTPDDQAQKSASTFTEDSSMSDVTSSESTAAETRRAIPAQVTDQDATSPESDQSADTVAVAEYDQGLAKSRTGFAARLNRFLANFRAVDEDFFEDLEEMLIEADVGFETAMQISEQLREEVKLQNAKSKKQIGQVIVEKMVDIYGEAGEQEDNSLHLSENTDPTVYLFVGVNGAGKTTTIGKLAARYHQAGQKVLLAAGDTFRAGAIEQLAEWARRTNTDVVTSKAGADPASVVFEAVKKAKAEHYDILLVDTAGRLQNNVNLMNELAKIKRVIVRELPSAPQEVLLVLDASTGQNALNQAKQFSQTTDVTGLILTKLDGSSKGGIVIAIRNELHLPVKLVGLGEKVTDLQDFDAAKFVYGLFKDLIEA